MAYANYAYLVEQFGENEVIRSADRDGNGVADIGVVDRALNDAASEIDSYIGAIYDVPLDPIPGVVVTHSGAIALYRMSLETGTYTKEKRQRYDDAIRWLRDVAAGKASLPGGEKVAPVSGGIRYFTQSIEYGRDQMWGIL